MKSRRRRKCQHCGELFQPDRRNLRHQKYCSQPKCRQASKAASQRRWLAKPGNRDYFRGPVNGGRVQAWRAAHPGYWKRSRRALQEDSPSQAVETPRDSATLVSPALQEVFSAQPLVLLGLIANLTGSALQEDIAHTSRRLLRLGQDILGGAVPPIGGDNGRQTGVMPRAGP
ncbi:MAG: hypothetical protein ACREXR_02245 [Gammaproteobacteria bacterium]